MPVAETEPLSNKTRVRVIGSLAGVPEGTAGTVRGTVGLALVRHRVEFDNGRFVTSVARRRLVPEGDWDEYLAEREREAEAEAAASSAADGTPAAADNGAGEAAGADDGGAAPADDRMAALLARSKAAREKKASGS